MSKKSKIAYWNLSMDWRSAGKKWTINKPWQCVVTSQVFSILCYAFPFWSTPGVGKAVISEIEKLHFRALRVVDQDRKQRMCRTAISSRTNHLPPKLWMSFTAASLQVKLWYTGSPFNLSASAFMNIIQRIRMRDYSLDLTTLPIKLEDTAIPKIGVRSSVLAEVKIPWTSHVLSNDRLRILLKSTFYAHDFIVFNHWIYCG